MSPLDHLVEEEVVLVEVTHLFVDEEEVAVYLYLSVEVEVYLRIEVSRKAYQDPEALLFLLEVLAEVYPSNE